MTRHQFREWFGIGGQTDAPGLADHHFFLGGRRLRVATEAGEIIHGQLGKRAGPISQAGLFGARVGVFLLGEAGGGGHDQ